MSRQNELERKLGRLLEPSKRGSVGNLNDFPEPLIAEARSLGSPLLAEELLRHYASRETSPYLKSFVQNVVFGEIRPRDWRRGRTLVPDVSIGEQLLWPAERLLAAIGGHFMVRTVPDLAAWKAGVPWTGAPARTEPDADYRTPVPPKAASLARAAVEPVKDPQVALRRWIAGRLARVVSAARPLAEISSLVDFATLAPLDNWSPDARAAGRALVRELRELGAPADAIPGFRGPDAWYREGEQP